jgi:hypothetical protein
MIKGKEAYLKKLTASINIKSMEIGRELEGSTPPSVFIKAQLPQGLCWPDDRPSTWRYSIMDTPETGSRAKTRRNNSYKLPPGERKQPVRVNVSQQACGEAQGLLALTEAGGV